MTFQLQPRRGERHARVLHRASLRIRVPRRASDLPRCTTARAMRTGWRAIETIDAPIISTSFGTRSACHCRGSSSGCSVIGVGSRSTRFASTSTPEAPSTAAWCTLAIERDVTVLEPLGDPHLPERPVMVERPARDLADERGELARAARAPGSRPGARGSRGRIRVLDPERVVEPERHPHDPAPERRERVDAGSRSARLTVSAVKPPGTSVGSRIATATRCMWLLGVSSDRKAASRPVMRSTPSDRTVPGELPGRPPTHPLGQNGEMSWLFLARAACSVRGSRSTRSGRRRAGSCSASASSPPG